MKIVVARYNEDITWTTLFPNVIIYNKGKPIENDYDYTILNLENVGREGHTYYKYICDNYESLDDYTIFLQGNPFDHSPNILDTLFNYTNKVKDDLLFEFISEKVSSSNIETEIIGTFVEDSPTLVDTYEKIFGKKPMPKTECIFGHGAQFIVAKRCILRKPKSFYEAIVKILEYSIGPVEGYHIERLHLYILHHM
jgi:hypothetical protein